MPTTDPGGTGPLCGVRVVDATAMVLGPLATLVMAQLGAEIIKVEPPGGDPVRFNSPGPAPGLSSTFACLNHGKRSLVLDLKTARTPSRPSRAWPSCRGSPTASRSTSAR